MQSSKLNSTERNSIDMAAILALYLAWFEEGTGEERCIEEGAVVARDISSGLGAPHIAQIEKVVQRFLRENLIPEVSEHFVLAIIESIAYTTSKFSAADRLNGPLYRSTAQKVLEGALSQIRNCRHEIVAEELG